MNYQLSDTGVILVLLQRLERQQLPGIVKIKEKLDNGKCLSEYEIEFIRETLHDTRTILPYLDRHLEYGPLFAKVMHYYKEITDRALTNEK